MASDATETQVRLVLEQQCADQFMAIVRSGAFGRHHFTLLMFDYLEEGGHVAYKTTLRLPALIRSFELLVAAWKTGLPRAAFAPTGFAMPDLSTLNDVSEGIVRPAGVGHVLLVGSGELTSYIASADRPGVLEMLETELLPNWRKESANA